MRLTAERATRNAVSGAVSPRILRTEVLPSRGGDGMVRRPQASTGSGSGWPQGRTARVFSLRRNLRDSGSLRPAHLDAFEQVTLHGRSPAEVAREFGLTRDCVYSIRHAVVRHLRHLRVQLAAALDEL